ncbi:hypothetical protein D3C77_735230 [compost metagenome]
MPLSADTVTYVSRAAGALASTPSRLGMKPEFFWAFSRNGRAASGALCSVCKVMREDMEWSPLMGVTTVCWL